jgi:hypothetical protein
MTDPRAAKMHSAHAGAPEMPTTTEVATTTEVGAAAKVASAAAKVASAAAVAASAAPSRSRVSRSSQNGREKNNGESFYPGHGTLERPPRVSNERGSVDYRITPGRCQSSNGRSRVHRNRPRTPTRFLKSNFRILEFES